MHEEFTIPEQLIRERRNMAPVEGDEALAASLPEEHGAEVRIDKRAVQESAPECQHRLGYLRTLPKNAAIPDECLGCNRIIECKHSFADPLENRPQRA
jgi:hypothetical protein